MGRWSENWQRYGRINVYVYIGQLLDPFMWLMIFVKWSMRHVWKMFDPIQQWHVQLMLLINGSFSLHLVLISINLSKRYNQRRWASIILIAHRDWARQLKILSDVDQMYVRCISEVWCKSIGYLCWLMVYIILFRHLLTRTRTRVPYYCINLAPFTKE